MEHRDLAGRLFSVAALALLAGAAPGRAFADLTVFAAGATTRPATFGGVALGLSLQPVGLEFEFAVAPGERAAGTPALQTGLFNLLVATPLRTGRRIQVYGSVGGGLYRERMEAGARTGLAASGGGGVHFHLAGPFRLRVDYRLFALRGDTLHSRNRRAYAGIGMAF